MPPLVSGTIIACVGLSLLPSALNSNIFQAAGNPLQNIQLALITVGVLLLVIFWSLLAQTAKIFQTMLDCDCFIGRFAFCG